MVFRNLVYSLSKAIKGSNTIITKSKRIPYMVVWNFTNMCNLRCKHCYQDAKATGTPDELTLNEKLDFVDTLTENKVKVPLISGGEPLIHPDFYPVLDKLVSKGMHVAAASNATMLYIQEGDERWGVTWDYLRQQWWMILERTEHNDWYDELPKWVVDKYLNICKP